MSSDAQGSAVAKFGPFDDGPLSIEERFTEQGRKRQDQVWQIYVQQDSVSAPLFDKGGLEVIHVRSIPSDVFVLSVCTYLVISD